MDVGGHDFVERLSVAGTLGHDFVVEAHYRINQVTLRTPDIPRGISKVTCCSSLVP